MILIPVILNSPLQITAFTANLEEICYDKDNVCMPWDDSRTLYKPQYSFVNLGKSRSVEKYKTTKRLLFNGFKISFYALSLIGLVQTLLFQSYR
jgi:hypothetical protein